MLNRQTRFKNQEDSLADKIFHLENKEMDLDE